MNPVKTIRIMCPNHKCRSILAVPETARGKNVKCSNCATLFKIPSQASQSSPTGAIPQ
jgi:LSD1 subclass zinc finger protein